MATERTYEEAKLTDHDIAESSSTTWWGRADRVATIALGADISLYDAEGRVAAVAEVKNRTGGLRQAELKAIRALAGEMLRLGEAEIDAMRATGRSAR